MQWGVKILACHPEVQHKLHGELVAKLPTINQQTTTFEEFSSTTRLPYLSAVAYELLRVSSTASAVTRDTTCDTTILDRPIPKGTQVVFPIAYTQHYESASHQAVSDILEPLRSESSQKNGRKYGYWADEDCGEFKPERWLTADGAFNSNAGPWMPFSFGFRGCFGQKLAVSHSF
jgi:cytochrome P450